MTEYRNKNTDSIPDEPSIEQLIESMKGRVKQTAKSYNGHVTNPLKQSSLQHDTAKDRYTNASTISSKPSVIDDGVNSYEFNHRKMGYAIFIINSEFDAQRTRPFADLDYRKMSKLFSTLGFEIKILNNKTNADLKMCLADIRNSIGRDHDCLACIMSSHGAEIPLSRQLNQDQKLREHVIYTKDAFLPTAEILQQFDDDHCENLAGKPKMFFIQACRCAFGDDENFDVDPGFDVKLSTDSNKMHTRHHINTGVCNKDGASTRHTKEMTETCVIPCNEDFLVMFASSSGRLGWSNEGTGGWLMHCLYIVFEKLVDTNYEMDLLQILSQVCGKMARYLESYCPGKEVYHRTKSAAVIYHMLTKSIYLKPKFGRMVEKIVPPKETYV